MRRLSDLSCQAFLADALGCEQSARCLYARASSAHDSTAKLILHQTARLVTLADWMDEVAPKRPALKVFFLVVLAEAVAKLAAGFEGEGKSRHHVRQFFAIYGDASWRGRLEHAFRRVGKDEYKFLSLQEAVDVLYEVRCDVAHRGEYFCFNLQEPGRAASITADRHGGLEAYLDPESLRSLVIRCSIEAAESVIRRQG